MINPESGTLLIAEPFLKDPSFMRSVVMICRHNDEEGTFGFALHKMMQVTLDQFIPGLEGHEIPVYLGGPVQTDTLHYIHNLPQYFDDCQKVADGIFWGGNFETMKSLITEGKIKYEEVKFFLGYSGWSAGQLEEEMSAGSWLVTEANKTLVLKISSEQVWNESLTQLGGKYKMMKFFPTDPQLN
jgi:putative transcriptional regulator